MAKNLTKALTIVAFLSFCARSRAQNLPNFKTDVVRLESTYFYQSHDQPHYGFIIGDSSNSKYFIIIDADKKRKGQPQVIRVIDSLRDTITAKRIGPEFNTDIKANGRHYYITLYKMQDTLLPVKKYTYSIDKEPHDSRFHPTWDWSIEFRLYFNSENHRYDLKPVSYHKPGIFQRTLHLFSSKVKEKHGQSGLPVLDDRNNLVGLVTENEGSIDLNDTIYKMLDISLIAQELRKFSRNYELTRNQPDCQFFNLIAFGQTAPVCATSTPVQFSAISAFNRLEREKDKNRRIAITVGAFGNYAAPEEAKSSLLGYSAGASIDFNPDNNGFKFSLGSKYQFAGFTPGDNQLSDGFQNLIKQVASRSIQIPAIVQYALSIKNEGDVFCGFGYNVGVPLSFTYTEFVGAPQGNINAPGETSEHFIISIKQFAAVTHKVLLEWGVETKRLRFSAEMNYQLNSFVKNYGLFSPNGGNIPVFNHIGRNMFFAEVGVSYRLWGYWKNGINLK
ncbi:hypothetical protein HDF19_20995 [Mucilaginibacter sp. E4BP6]|uniref:hypothetical protein n=1 Tax=Mucilaginibacter sp. E4BP6 TaxID=2723089 RepID=UPI0015CACD79|nr:hypothetical protein [Mucilaginibacter sp. E4BP6]NYE68163.1 hypothetical protein [Mucilaginibacter sp. E4BP6]